MLLALSGGDLLGDSALHLFLSKNKHNGELRALFVQNICAADAATTLP